jgi:predicted GIY-YIG superfamily endonuclease
MEKGVKRHNLGEVLSTKNYLPFEIIIYTAFTDKYKAYAFERYLK